MAEPGILTTVMMMMMMPMVKTMVMTLVMMMTMTMMITMTMDNDVFIGNSKQSILKTVMITSNVSDLVQKEKK